MPVFPPPPALPAHRWTVGYLSPAKISAGSLEWVRCPVHATENGAPYDPTTDIVEMAFTAVDVNPGSMDWRVAQWEETLFAYGFNIACLVGSGGTGSLSAGRYSGWVHVADNPEIPVRSIGILTVA